MRHETGGANESQRRGYDRGGAQDCSDTWRYGARLETGYQLTLDDRVDATHGRLPHDGFAPPTTKRRACRVVRVAPRWRRPSERSALVTVKTTQATHKYLGIPSFLQ